MKTHSPLKLSRSRACAVTTPVDACSSVLISGRRLKVHSLTHWTFAMQEAMDVFCSGNNTGRTGRILDHRRCALSLTDSNRRPR